MNARVGALRRWLDGQSATEFLVTAPVNVYYLSGFDSSSSALLVGADAVHVFTDARSGEAARALEGLDAVVLERNLFAELGSVLDDYTRGPVAFEASRLTVAARDQLAKCSAELVPATNVLERIRAIKDTEELAAIRRAAEALSVAFERVPQLEPVGKTERELAWRLERMMREDLGAEALSFPAIVASGPNSAKPHHRAGERVIGPNEILLIDTGCVIGGYCSDCTRLYASGALAEELNRAYAVCRDVQERAVAAIRPGVELKELDTVYRDELDANGYSVDHSLGHGVGAEIHEEPRLARTSTGALERGQVVTVEPGIYLPGVGGVRIEDMVVVEDSGGVVITLVTKDLVAV